MKMKLKHTAFFTQDTKGHLLSFDKTYVAETRTTLVDTGKENGRKNRIRAEKRYLSQEISEAGYTLMEMTSIGTTRGEVESFN